MLAIDKGAYHDFDVVVMMCDIDTNEVLFLNEFAKNKFYLDDEQVAEGLRCWDIFSDEKGPCSNCTSEALFSEEHDISKSVSSEKACARDGKIYKVVHKITEIDGKQVRVSIAMDISENKNNCSEFEDIECVFRHKIKNKLNSIALMASFLSPDDEDFDEVLGKMTRMCRETAKLVDSQNIVTALYSGEYRVTSSFVNMNELLGNLVYEYQTTAGRKLISIKQNYEHEGSYYVYGDYVMLYSAFENIVENAIMASPENCEIDFNVYMENDYVVIETENFGEVPEEIRSMFFEKFISKGKVHGSGIGTYAVQLIAKSHGGYASLDSTVKGKTKVLVRLKHASLEDMETDI